jgi:hypothetical protein
MDLLSSQFVCHVSVIEGVRGGMQMLIVASEGSYSVEGLVNMRREARDYSPLLAHEAPSNLDDVVVERAQSEALSAGSSIILFNIYYPTLH